ncbi:MAG: putative phosphatase [Hyphomicrobiales bacterium]|nr:putative phosphatase [Hyphomicrobiales bacterium]
MPFDAILFDKDGTLVDFDQTWGPAAYDVMKTLAAGHEGAFRSLAEVTRFNPRDKHFSPDSPFLTGDPDIYVPLWARALGRRDLPRLHEEIASLFRIAALSSLTPIGDPAALTRCLGADGYRLGIVSNDSEGSIRLQAGMLNILDDLDFIAGHDSGFGAKPDPGMIVAFAGAFCLSPHRIAVVGDTVADVRAAHAAGAVAIGVLTGPRHREDIDGADYVIDSIDDLPDLLASLTGGRRASARG